MKTRKIKQSNGPKPPITRLKELPEDERAKLMAILRANTYEAAGPLVENVFGFACSRQVLSKFFQWQTTQEDLDQANDTMAQVEEFIARQNKDWTPEKVRNAAITFFTAQTTSNKDLDGFVTVANLDLNERKAKTKAGFEREKIDLQKRKLVLLEKKAAQADAAKEVINSALSPEDQRARLKEILR
jgi:hypothetical protein